MKPFVICTLLAAFELGASLMPQQASAQQASVNFQVFYDALSPYGMWVDHPGYGYVWIPDREPGFSPYATGGYWVYTEDGWTWVSDYPWGWAPFHYGRWDNEPRYGWFWVPGDEWGPAWVSWRRSPGYYGWAPMRPGISVSMAFGRDYRERDDRWIFVRDGNERASAPSKVMQPGDIRPAAGNDGVPRARAAKPLEVNTPANRSLPARREAQPRQPAGSQREKEKKNREKQP